MNYSTTRQLIKFNSQAIVEVVEANRKLEDKFDTMLFLPIGEGRQGVGGLRTNGYFKVGGVIPYSNFKSNSIHKEKTLITVITVVYNGEQFLEETILSVINQNYDNIEYIIIDGGSTDGTLDIIKKYEHAIDYWVSEKDKGIYDAMNKSLTLSFGEFVFHLNAGDRLNKEAIGLVFTNGCMGASLIVGGVRYDSGRVFNPKAHLLVIKNMIHHQSAFYLLNTLKQIGLYQLKYSILADYYLNCKIYKLNLKIKKVSVEVSVCANYGVSDIPNIKNYLEEICVRESIFGLSIITIILRIFSYFRFFIKKIRVFICP